MTEKIQYIPARLKNAAKGGHMAGVEDIVDDLSGKTQQEINSSVDADIEILQNETAQIDGIKEDIREHSTEFDYVNDKIDTLIERSGGGGDDVSPSRRAPDYSEFRGMKKITLYPSETPDSASRRAAGETTEIAYQAVLTQENFTESNAIYVIQFDFTLGEDVTIPANCTLKFDGGSISGNGTGKDTITGQNTIIPDTSGNILNGVKLVGTFNCSLRPEWFGANGDGTTDDTQALRLTLYNSHTLGKEVLLGTKKYLISDSLNYFNGTYNDITLRVKGSSYKSNTFDGSYAPDNTGGIFSTSAVIVFRDATIRGYIHSVKINSVRTLENNYVFYNCQLSNLDIFQCQIANFGAFLADSSIGGVSTIRNNRMLTICYFVRKINSTCKLVDSFIENNWINGGEKNKDNVCFEFGNYNGSYIRNNFIDYYRTIYSPKSASSINGGSINSIGNHYQVFLYFYNNESDSNITSFELNSNGDAFNWTDPSTLEYLNDTPKISIGTTIEECPPYIFRLIPSHNINIKGAILEANLGNIFLVVSSINTYKDGQYIFEVNRQKYDTFDISYVTGGTVPGSPIYNGGQYVYKKIKTNYIFSSSTLPTYDSGRCKVIPGMKFLVGGILYLADVVYDEDNSIYQFKWTKISS